jgi:hypothetical protein
MPARRKRLNNERRSPSRMRLMRRFDGEAKNHAILET